MRTPFLLPFAAAIAVAIFALPSTAHHRPGHAGGPPHRQEPRVEGSRINNNETTEQDSQSFTPLTARQRRILIEILRGDDDDTVISPATRRDIRGQLDTLPPGIQRRLARGRSLPPGIAKKIYLPYQLNTHLDLEENVRIVVVGANVVVVDPVTELIVDVIREILL